MVQKVELCSTWLTPVLTQSLLCWGFQLIQWWRFECDLCVGSTHRLCSLTYFLLKDQNKDCNKYSNLVSLLVSMITFSCFPQSNGSGCWENSGVWFPKCIIWEERPLLCPGQRSWNLFATIHRAVNCIAVPELGVGLTLK